MKVLRADAMGMCFGVRDALRAVTRVERPREVTVWGEIVHNEVVLEDLSRRGFVRRPEGDRERFPVTARVLVTAHGISDRERRWLVAAGKLLIDTTCPLVRRAHAAAKELAGEGRHVLVVGRPGHVEVLGLTGDLSEVTVVPGPEEAGRVDSPRLGVIFQTTTEAEHALRTAVAIRRANPDASIRVVDTVCRPTKERQAALLRLLDEIDLLVVVGGRNSNNSRALARRASERGVRACRVAQADELRARWFRDVATVGLTAGTSTLPETVDEVERTLLAMDASSAAVPLRFEPRPAIA